MAHKISPDTVNIGTGLERLFSFNWLYGFALSIVLYVGFHLAVPDRPTTIPAVMHGVAVGVDGVDTDSERQQSQTFRGKASMEVGGVKEVEQ